MAGPWNFRLFFTTEIPVMMINLGARAGSRTRIGKRPHTYSPHAYRRVYHSATLAYPELSPGITKTLHAMKTILATLPH